MTSGVVRTAARLVGLACAAAALGCGGGDGPNKYRVTGTATFDGQPIPAGLIVFTPDVSQKNDGPQGVAEIHNGSYDTRGGKGKHVVGGPMAVSVTGLTADGRPLCQHDYKADLPRGDATENIAVPKSAASKPAKGGEDS